MNDALRAEILKLHADGLYLDEAADTLEITRNAVRKRARRAGVRFPIRPKVEIDIETAYRMVKSGEYTFAEVHRETGLPERKWRQIREELGLRRKFRRVTDEDVERMSEMLGEQMSYREIGRTLDLEWRSVASRFPGRGWTPQQAIEYRYAKAQLDSL